jgi:hypothetical protein
VLPLLSFGAAEQLARNIGNRRLVAKLSLQEKEIAS